MGEFAWVVLVGVGLLGVALANWVRRREQLRDIPRGKLGGFTVAEVAGFLMAQYRQGHLHPQALEAARQLSPPLIDPFAMSLNIFVCLEVAAGCYREALEWRPRWKATLSGDGDAVVTINEAEALACLGMLEASLALVEPLEPKLGWVRTARAAHRAWVLAELGRLDEARAQLAEIRFGVDEPFPYEFIAELWFSRFAVALAERNFEAAWNALAQSRPFVVRESSRRNLFFYSARLASAQGKLEAAADEFAIGGANVYRAQGGPCLVEWGCVLTKLGRHEEAREVWRRCLVEDPQSPAADIARAHLDEVPSEQLKRMGPPGFEPETKRV